MPDTAETLRAITERMMDEELAMVLHKLHHGQQLSIFQSAVLAEAERRSNSKDGLSKSP